MNRRTSLLVLVCASACFSEGSGSTTAGDSGSGTATTTTSTADSTAETTGSGETTSITVADASGDSTTSPACVDATFEGVTVDVNPIELFVVALPGIDPAVFNAAFASDEVVSFIAATGARVVFMDPMVGLAAPAGACTACETGSCTTAVDLTLPSESSPFLALLDPDPYSCVLHLPVQEPRRRLVVLGASPVVDDVDAMAMETLIGGDLWDVDMACPGCDATSPGFTQTIAAAGGMVSDLDDLGGITYALLTALAPPPRCGWAVTDAVEPPLGLDDLVITIDTCAEPPCPLELEQVSGLGTCDSDDPSASEFVILEDAIGEDTSLALLCPPACAALRRVFSELVTVTHTYRCG